MSGGALGGGKGGARGGTDGGAKGLEGKLVVAKVARGAVPLVALKVALTVEGWVALRGH